MGWIFFSLRPLCGVLFECSLMKSCNIEYKGKKMSYDQYIKKYKSIPKGSKIEFIYFNRGASYMRPMCDTIKIL